MDLKSVAVIGAGTMGHGIAQVAATAGFFVHLNDVDQKFLDSARAKITDSLERFASKGKISAADKEQISSRITYTTDFTKAVEHADLVVEAVYENLDVKKDIFRKLSTSAPATAILATNTSQYSITEIASVVPTPERVIGMHWFNPPVMMKLIEVVRGHETSDQTVEYIKAFAAKVGKETVVCKDSQGFISTRALMALRLECYRILEEGVATKEDIDKTLRLALGHPMGQFELADFSGLDLDVPVAESLTKIFGDRFRAPQTVLHLVKAGRLGRKTGRGWYNYTDARSAKV